MRQCGSDRSKKPQGFGTLRLYSLFTAMQNLRKRRLNMKNVSFNTVTKLGKGGNAKVSLVKDTNGNVIALKELTNKTKEKKARFINEIDIMKQYGSKESGVLPIIDYSKEEYWYTMPVATPIMKYITDNNLDIKALILEFIKLCGSLSFLHSNNITHRDIKPDNLYYYYDRFFFGDFGLVDFPDNNNNLTRSDKGIGAIFTIAPEMKRNPKEADGKKADVYSMAKTLWMLLSLDKKGFDGEYNYFDSVHALNNFSHLRKCHLVEIEELIKAATNNDPDKRPTIDEFSMRLVEWLDVNNSFSKRQKSEWAFLHKNILNGSGESVTWRNIDEIIDVLNKISMINSYNHMFYPNGGGQDFVSAEKAAEQNCIYIYDDCRSCNIVSPMKLHFECFPNHEEWNYFLLELGDLTPIFNGEIGYEYLVEDTPAHYVSSQYAVYGVYDYESGEKYPEGYKTVYRYTNGKFLFVLKDGPYNAISNTYDGRHNLCSADAFREYIEKLIFKCDEAKNSGICEDIFFLSQTVNRNPFIVTSEVNSSKKSLNEIISSISISKTEYEQCFFDLSRITFNETSNASFYLTFELNDGSFDFDDICLCKDGHLRKRSDIQISDVFFVRSRIDAHRLKKYCEYILQEFTKDKDGTYRSYWSYFIINILNSGKPSHLFTEDEIKNLMYNADDRNTNTLVIDENGFALIISNNEADVHSYPVRHEPWNAGNLYVGKYSELSTLHDTYISSLQGWLMYLQCGNSIRMDYIHENTNEIELIRQIKEFY